MRSLHIVFPSRMRATLDLTPHHLFMFCAAVVGAALMAYYVHLLDESVARGVRMRAEVPVSVATNGRRPIVSSLRDVRSVTSVNIDTADTSQH
jgi:hypothetical protein